jgi:undecaprenyl-diphosphatase
MTSRRPPSSVACLLAIAATLITTFQAIVLGALQGVSELFPISSLGHTVIFPHLFGWNNIVRWESQPESPWLAFIVMLHVGSAIGLLIYFWRDWVALVRAFFATLAKRRIETPTERLAWLIVVASLPVGLLGLAFEHTLRVATAKPEIASIFLVVNGVMLLGAERLRRRAAVRELAREQGLNADGARRLETLSFREAAVIGLGESTALVAGISRDGVVMATGLARGLDNADAAHFGFLLATPIILAAGILKFGDLLGHDGDHGVRLAALIAAVVAAAVAVVTVHFLTQYFKRGNLIPFGIYCLLFGTAMAVSNS